MRIMERRLVSISSAPGWSVRVVENGAEYTATLAAWALVEVDGGDRHVVGLVQRGARAGRPPGTIGLADEIDGFAGYSFTGLSTRSVGAES
jgi:hypothetical protein